MQVQMQWMQKKIGVTLEGKLLNNKLYYAAGVFNGTGKSTFDNNENKDAIGRVVTSPFKGSGNLSDRLSLGGSYQAGGVFPFLFILNGCPSSPIYYSHGQRSPPGSPDAPVREKVDFTVTSRF